MWGLSVLTAGLPEEDWPVELIASSHLAVPGCVTYLSPLPRDDITDHDGVRLTTRDRTALDCARSIPKLDAVAALGQFCRLGVDLEALWHRETSWRVRGLLSLADPGAASPRESRLRVMLMDSGLPRPATQIRVPLSADRTAYLDLGWKDYKVAVEYDGQRHHTSQADRRHDEARREELKRQGWRVIAIRKDVIPGRTAELLQHVADALIQRGWEPGTAVTNRILSRIRAARRKPRLTLPGPGRCLPCHGGELAEAAWTRAGAGR